MDCGDLASPALNPEGGPSWLDQQFLSVCRKANMQLCLSLAWTIWAPAMGACGSCRWADSTQFISGAAQAMAG